MTALKIADRDHALKIENFPEVKIEIMDKISDVLLDIAEKLDFSNERTSPIYCRSCDGFIPHSWNQGGWQAYGYTDINGIIGSGMFTGSEKFNNLIHEYYDQAYLEVEKELEEINDENREEFYQKLDESVSGDYSSISVEYQGRYLGYDSDTKKHTISLNIFLSATDAPYHRSSDDDMEIKIEFTDKQLMSNKIKGLDEAVNKMSKFIGSTDLW
jgi:hypothetical protein